MKVYGSLKKIVFLWVQLEKTRQKYKLLLTYNFFFEVIIPQLLFWESLL